jgi:hypothetical protein
MVWTVIVKLDVERASCTVCNKTTKHSGNTKHLWQHAERHHPKLYRDLCAKKEQEKVREGGATGPARCGSGPSAAGDKKQGQNRIS